MIGRLAIVFLAALFVGPSHLAAWNEPEGFKDYKFGMTRSEVESLARPKIQNKNSFAPTEQIGDIKVTAHFRYEKDAQGLERLGEISFFFQTRSQYLLIKSAFIERYGTPTSTSMVLHRNGFGAQFKSEHLKWNGETISISIEEIATAKDGYVSISTITWERQFRDKYIKDVNRAAKDS